MDREVFYGLVQGQRKVLNRSFTPFLNMEMEKGLLFGGYDERWLRFEKV